MEHRGIRTWKEEVLISRVAPADEVGRLSVRMTSFQDFAVAIGLANSTSTDHDPVSNFRFHRGSIPGLLHIHGHPDVGQVQGRRTPFFYLPVLPPYEWISD